MTRTDRQQLDEAVQWITRTLPDATPVAGMILGSGWGGCLDGFSILRSIPYGEIPGLGHAGAPGHEGMLLHAERNGNEWLLFKGRRHLYEGVSWAPILIPIWVLKRLGAPVLLLTNAAGGIREDLDPGSLMVIEDHINWMGKNPLSGPHDPLLGERFPDQTEVYDRELREWLRQAGANASGVYLATAGPVFETPAEVRAGRTLGADAVGMSTVPEAVFASALGLRVAGLCCISNRAAGLGSGRLSGEDVVRTVKEAGSRMKRVVEGFADRVLERGGDELG